MNQRPPAKRPNSRRSRNFKNRRPQRDGEGNQAQAQAKDKERGREPNSERPRPPAEDYSRHVPTKPLRCQVVFYDSFPAARADREHIKTLCSSCDQLNVVVRAEGDMDDADLLGIDPRVKVFAGAAWALIHDRRVEEGWYAP